MADTDPAELRRFAIDLAGTTGAWLYTERSVGRPAADTKSSATDMVTEFDRAAEARIVSAVRANYPDDGIVGEEGTGHEGTSGRQWLIDPIDGTTNFLYGLPGWAVSIAVTDADGGIAGAVAVPAYNEVFSAHRGGGATCNGHAIAPTSLGDVSAALVATGFSYDPDRRRQQARRVSRLIASVRDIRRVGAASVDLCAVACGRVDAYIESRLGPWDIAAGALIAGEAGCRLTDYRGEHWGTHEVFAAAPGIHSALLQLWQGADAPDAPEYTS
jgi:myo-inositol-1(or 4)-monophosphatase